MAKCAVVIALLDYGSGNLRSVQKALQRAGAEVRLAACPDGLRDAAAAVLPGVLRDTHAETS